MTPNSWEAISFKKWSKYGHCPKRLNPPPSILGSHEALLRLNCDILQNETKERKTSFCWLLKMYYAFELNTVLCSRTF